MEIIDLSAIKEIFGKNSFLGYSCYISHGLPSDTLTVEILLELPEIWTPLHRAVGSLRYGPLFIEPLVAISRIRSRVQTLAAVY